MVALQLLRLCLIRALISVQICHGKTLQQFRGRAATVAQSNYEGDPAGYLIDTLDKFGDFADTSRNDLAEEHASAQERLQKIVAATNDTAVSLALKQTLTSNTQTFLETKSLYDLMLNFSATMSTFLKGPAAQAPACKAVICGRHATCTVTSTGDPACICNQGYVGLGEDCHAPAEFVPHHLVVGSSAVTAFEINVAVFGDDRIAVVYRDSDKNNIGYVIVGRVKDSGVAAVAPPEQFTTMESGPAAHNPVVAGSDRSRIAIVWRDKSVNGACWLRGGLLGTTGIRGADTAVQWGVPTNFCESQSHKMAIVPFAEGRFAVLYAGMSRVPKDAFGSAILASVGASAVSSVLGQFRFTDGAVCRLEVTKLSQNSFIVATRAARRASELEPTKTVKQEALAIFGELVGDDLVFDPNPANIERDKPQIWARGVSRVSANAFAFAYQDGTELNIKVSIVTLDENSHQISNVGKPKIIRRGFSPYVSAVSMDTPGDPHTFVYYQEEKGNTSMVSLCSWRADQQQVNRCQEFPWLDRRLESVSSVPLSGGRFLFTFSTEAGEPYYMVVGVSTK